MTINVESAPEGGAAHFGADKWIQLQHFAEMLVNEGELRGLVGPRELARLWTRHIMNSAAIVEYIPRNSHVADVGSGAGFPGIVGAVLCPDVQWHLIDSMERRCHWLMDVREALSLENVQVHCGRSESFASEVQVDIVTSRAVAALKKLLPLCTPLLREGGKILALKGERVDEEIDAADRLLSQSGVRWLDVHRVRPFGTNEETRVLEIQFR